MKSYRHKVSTLTLLALTQCTAALPIDRGLEQASIGSPSRGYLAHPAHLSPRGAGYVLFRTRAEGLAGTNGVRPL